MFDKKTTHTEKKTDKHIWLQKQGLSLLLQFLRASESSSRRTSMRDVCICRLDNG